jgi:electron transfer flavoprotein alpha subunit
MGEIFVLVEHRKGEIRDVSFEMLYRANQLCQEFSHDLTAIVLGDEELSFLKDLTQKAKRVLAFQDKGLANFDTDLYKETLDALIEEHRPFLTLMGHTSWGMDLAPALSVRTGYPLATDCVDIRLEEGRPVVIRQIYSGKVFSRVSFKESSGYLVTVRPGSFTPEETAPIQGELIQKELPSGLPQSRRQFVELQDAGAGKIDISQAELLISVGRGIGEAENIGLVEELAELMGGVLSCSRPVVDKNWLPKYHQVGTSGKSVKPKVYLAFGISGAFQHVAGITGAGTVIAVNKDKKAPIFRAADYGVVEDLFKMLPAIKEKLQSA